KSKRKIGWGCCFKCLVGGGEGGRWGGGEVGRWGSGEVGKWGSGEMGIMNYEVGKWESCLITLSPQNPITLSPQNPKTPKLPATRTQ
ncbi:MAG: hypothetical protein EHM73_14475, partial [Chroococcales cyanobacterium metabat2.561]